MVNYKEKNLSSGEGGRVTKSVGKETPDAFGEGGLKLNRGDNRRLTKAEYKLKEIEQVQRKANDLYKNLVKEQKSQQQLIYLGFIIIIITCLGVAIAFLEVTMSYFNDRSEAEYLQHRYTTI